MKFLKNCFFDSSSYGGHFWQPDVFPDSASKSYKKGPQARGTKFSENPPGGTKMRFSRNYTLPGLASAPLKNALIT